MAHMVKKFLDGLPQPIVLDRNVIDLEVVLLRGSNDIFA